MAWPEIFFSPALFTAFSPSSALLCQLQKLKLHNGNFACLILSSARGFLQVRPAGTSRVCFLWLHFLFPLPRSSGCSRLGDCHSHSLNRWLYLYPCVIQNFFSITVNFWVRCHRGTSQYGNEFHAGCKMRFLLCSSCKGSGIKTRFQFFFFLNKVDPVVCVIFWTWRNSCVREWPKQQPDREQQTLKMLNIINCFIYMSYTAIHQEASLSLSPPCPWS